jgi:hypothetical protein
MDDAALVYPMFAMVLLTFSTLVRLFRARSASVADGTVDSSYFKVYQGNTEPERSAQLARHFTNQFESPVLFYACCLGAMAVHATNVVILALAWIYIALRAIHAYIHTGKNRLMPRIRAYLSSWAVLLLMWGALIVQIAR